MQNIMAGERGLWNIGGINLPDYSITENINKLTGGALFGGSLNSATYANNDALKSNSTTQVNNKTVPIGTLGASKNYTSYVNNGKNNSNVLGASTTQQQGSGGTTQNTGGSGGSGRDAFNSLRSSGGYGGWDEAAAWADFQATGGRNQGGGGGGVDDIMAQIDGLFGKGSEMLDSAANSARDAFGRTKENLESQIGTQVGRVQEQGEELIGDANREQERFNKVLATALEEAVRGYNSLVQKGVSRYGGGSSAGQAMGELAQREFFREQGKVNEKQAEGTEAFALERTKIGKYVADKIQDFNMFKEQSLVELKNQLDRELAQINSQRYDLEANRARDKMAILQDSVNRARQIQEQDYNVKLQLGSAAIEKMQEISGRAFTPAEIQATLAEFGINLNMGRGGPAQAQGGIARRPGQEEDELDILG